MCDLQVQANDDLWALYKNYVGAAKVRYAEAVIKALDAVLIPMGYEGRPFSMGDAHYVKGNRVLSISYCSEGFIHGTLYPIDPESDSEIDIGLFQEKGKKDALTIDEFVAILKEKEKGVTF